MSFARIRSLVIVSLLAVAALVVVILAITKDRQTQIASAAPCQSGQIPVSLTLPEAKNVKLRVFNGSGRPGLAAQVTDDFQNRKFSIAGPPANTSTFKGVASLRYGPKAVSAAWLIRAYFLNQVADGGFDVKRKDDVVDVIIGTDYRQLGTSTEVNQAIAQLGSPSPPPGTCPAG